MSKSFDLYLIGTCRWAARQCGAICCGLSLLLLPLATPVQAQDAAAPDSVAPDSAALDNAALDNAEPAADDGLILPPLPEGDSKYPEVVDAQKLFEKGDNEGALKLLVRAKELYPQLYPPQILMARMAMARNQMSLARSMLEQAVEEMPNDPSGYQFIGEFAVRENRLVEAEMVFDRAAELLAAYEADEQLKRELQIHLHTYQAAIALRREQWLDAETELRAWLELKPDVADAHFNLGQALFKQQRYEDALAEFEIAAQSNKVFPPADVALGRLYAREGDAAKAEECMQRALEKNPKDIRTLLGVADWQLLNGQFEEARPHAELAVEVDSTSLPAKLMAGTVARFLGDTAAAEKYFEQAFLQSPSNFQAIDQLALVLAEQDDDSKRRRALQLAETNARQYPNDPAALATLGWVYFQHNRLADALNVFQALNRSMRINGDAAFYFAKITNQMKRKDDAKRWLEVAVNSTAPFVHRAEAEKMLKELGGKVPASAPGASSSGAAEAP